jgi:glycosyltransferase involved in cell wall biosynthesis
MRLLMTTDTVGGVWTFTEELTTGLLARGSSVHLVSLGRMPSAAQCEWSDRLARESCGGFSYTALNVPLEWMEDNDRAYSEAAAALIDIALEFGANLLHSNQFCFGALPLLIPKVVTAHSDVYSWARCCRGADLPSTPWLERYSRLMCFGLAGANTITAPSRWMAAWIDRTFDLLHRPEVIPNGRSLPADPGAPRKLQAVTAGRLWDEAKNIAMLANVDPVMPLLIAGEPAHESTTALPRFAQVEFLGSLASRELLSHFRESAIYVCTSRYEPFGLAPLEAALCGCAVVANDIPSLREIWADDALYFTDAGSLTRLLSRLSGDPARLAAAQQRSLRRARTYTADRMVNAYLRVFQAAISPNEEAWSCLAVSA